MKKVIGGKLYDTSTAEAIADNEFSDGSNKMPGGRCSTLYKTQRGNFFVHHETCWQGEHDSIEPLTKGEAIDFFENINGDGDFFEIFGTHPEIA